MIRHGKKLSSLRRSQLAAWFVWDDLNCPDFWNESWQDAASKTHWDKARGWDTNKKEGLENLKKSKKFKHSTLRSSSHRICTLLSVSWSYILIDSVPCGMICKMQYLLRQICRRLGGPWIKIFQSTGAYFLLTRRAAELMQGCNSVGYKRLNMWWILKMFISFLSIIDCWLDKHLWGSFDKLQRLYKSRPTFGCLILSLHES